MRIKPQYKLADLYFKLAYKIGILVKPRDLQSRVTSYPYMCWDTYFHLSDFQITNKNDLIELQSILQIQSIHTVYLLTSLLDEFIETVKNSKYEIKKLVIGETDDHNSVSKLIPLLRYIDKIYANHLVGDHPKISAFPVGIERQSYRSSGKLKNFKKVASTNPKKRNIPILVAWNDSTNTNRANYKKEFELSNKTLIIQQRVSASTLHNMMRKTLFVPCPAGNGIDTHRVWESIYLGAVPVILKSEFCGNEKWPVLLVDSWRYLINKNLFELQKIYENFALSQKESLAFGTAILADVFGRDNV